MRKYILPGMSLLILVILLTAFKNPGNNDTPIIKKKFSQAEMFKYRVFLGFFGNAGEATIVLNPGVHDYNGQSCYKAEVYGKSSGLWSAFFRIRDNWGAYFDTTTLLPVKSYRNIEEGKYRKYESVDYHQDKKSLVLKNFKEPTHENQKMELEQEVPFEVYDLVSGAFYLRALDYDQMQKGDTLNVKGYLDKETFSFNIIFDGRTTVKTRIGKFKAFKLTPIMPDNKLFKGENAISVWISDDINKVPLKVKAEMFVGSVGIEITEFQFGNQVPNGIVNND
ncbi:DUF3108 domain-containing protein [Xanthovirga aplysinae]|uniref:DUF3108 domain-containing protein n=1 Tax=Xanthovirga aplysinae TaxID=2529853 RepID=UPI0012BBFAC8|nr:DUF3108 domain-containing protein [Xanthovirga aplysinae]MTI33410.1 DUF3108 domain-containing protein [Xanthovirga aplysinae]